MSILAKAGEVGRISELAPLSEAKRKLLQGFVSGQIRPSQAGPGKISVRPSGQHAPLSLAQEKLWRTALSSEGVPSFYNESITLHRTGRLDMERLEQSFTEIIRRHQAWRTTFD